MRWQNLGLAVAVLMSVAAVPARGPAGPDVRVHLAAADPTTYDHEVGGGVVDDGNGAGSQPQLAGEDFACGDVVSHLVLVEVGSSDLPADGPRVVEVDLALDADSTGQSGVGHGEVVAVGVNDVGDRAVSGDGGSTARLVSSSLSGQMFQRGSQLLVTVEVDDLEPGEVVVVRIDTRLLCAPGSSPTGTVQTAVTGARVTGPASAAADLRPGRQTVPLRQADRLGGVGDPVLSLAKTAMAAGGTCGVDDGVGDGGLEAGDEAHWCLAVRNDGTVALDDVRVVDDGTTPDDAADDVTFEVGPLAPGAVTMLGIATGPHSAGPVTNSAVATGSFAGVPVAPAVASASRTVAAVNRPPSPLPDTARVTVGETVRIPVLDNDVDPDGDDLAVTSTSQPTLGRVSILHGVVVFEAATVFPGTYDFVYTVVDEHGLAADATVTVEVAAPPNRPPSAADDVVAVLAGGAATIVVLENDEDPDGDPLLVTVVEGPTRGTATVRDDGSIRYVPAAGLTGPDTLRYAVDDGRGGRAEALVRIDVADGVVVEEPPSGGRPGGDPGGDPPARGGDGAGSSDGAVESGGDGTTGTDGDAPTGGSPVAAVGGSAGEEVSGGADHRALGSPTPRSPAVSSGADQTLPVTGASMPGALLTALLLLVAGATVLRRVPPGGAAAPRRRR